MFEKWMLRLVQADASQLLRHAWNLSIGADGGSLCLLGGIEGPMYENRSGKLGLPLDCLLSRLCRSMECLILLARQLLNDE